MKFHVLKKFVKPISIVVCVGVVLVAAINWQSWFPETQKWVESTVASFRSGTTDEEHAEDTEDPHAGHDHADHAGHDDASSLELSKQALGNIGLTSEYLQPVKLETFRKEMTVPGDCCRETRTYAGTGCDTVNWRCHARTCPRR